MKKFIAYQVAAAFMLLVATASSWAQETDYRRPSPEIEEMILAAPQPTVVFNNDFTMAAVATRGSSFTPLAEMVKVNEFKVAGLRLNADNFSQTRRSSFQHIYLMKVDGGARIEVAGIPSNPKMHDFAWSPGGRYLCFLNDRSDEVELYRIDVTAPVPTAVKINANRVNTTLGQGYAFLGEDKILYKSVPRDMGEFPSQNIPEGPIVQESIRKSGTYRTTQDLLKSPYDEAVFEYLCTSIFSVFDGNGTRTIGEKGIIKGYTLSPDRTYMMVTTEHRPYSYSKGHGSFPYKTEIWSTADGRVVKLLRDTTPKKPSDEKGRPDANDIKDAKDAKDAKDVKKPERKPTKGGFEWREDRGAVLVWTETLPSADRKAGDDNPDADRRPPFDEEDKDDGKPERTRFTSLWQCGAPFDIDNDKELVLTSEFRLGRVLWGNDRVAVYQDNSSKQKISRTFLFNPSDTSQPHRLLLTEDTSLDTLGNRPVIGTFHMERTPSGGRLLVVGPRDSYLLLSGNDRRDSEEDPFAFIDRLNLKDGKIEPLWSAKAPFQESITGIRKAADKQVEFITKRESFDVYPNYWKVTASKGKVSGTQVTHFENNIPHFNEIRREFITYERADGVKCAAQLFLPAGYDPARDGRLPVFLWTYPYEHRSVARAQYSRRATRYNFMTPGTSRQYMWPLKGYAVVLNWSMPIIAAKNGGQPNDEFRKNLIMNAEAIIDHLVEIGIGDRDKMAVGGHSYGAFMTGNLLSLTRLFRLGIANSGAYNRSLTPYGFQSENRDFWKAQQVYMDMSPYNNAHKVKDAILLTHGQMDENTGTHPIQSERFYYAIAGHNGTAKWLQLPYEGHGYSYTENILHYLYEVEQMLDKYVKNAKPREAEKEDKEVAKE